MKTLQINEKDARRLYKDASLEFRTVLETTFGKEFFKQSTIDRIDSWEDILSETGRPDTPSFDELPEDLRDHFQKYYRVLVMTEAYNEGEKMDIYNSDKYRHYPYFKTNGKPSAFAFDSSIYGDAFALAGSASRLSFKDEKTSMNVGKKHTDIYREYLES